MPVFSNRPNERIELDDQRVLFLSRSLAIMAMVVAHDSKTNAFHVLVGRRGPAVDYSDLHCMVCGYLDWDETLSEAMQREVYEEAGLDLAAVAKEGITVPEQPISIRSEPDAHLQNVTARFIVPLPRRFPIHTKNAEPGEVESVQWLELTRAGIEAHAWAFDHDEILLGLSEWLMGESDAGRLRGDAITRFIAEGHGA